MDRLVRDVLVSCQNVSTRIHLVYVVQKQVVISLLTTTQKVEKTGKHRKWLRSKL